MKIGIIGAGAIAEKMATTLQGMGNEAEAYAIASRDLAKAEAFAARWGFTRAYGSYEAMLDDAQVELVYVATPHSHHYEHVRMCLLKGKHVLCEKSFTANAREAEEVLALAREKKLFLAEAIWTRYLPMSQTLKEVIDSGVIGKPMMLSASLCYPILHKVRNVRPELAGGALLDLGVYTLNFAMMLFGTDIKEVVSTCTKMETGVDVQDSITLVYNDGRMAVLNCSFLTKSDRSGVISGEHGHIIVTNINNPESIKVVNSDYQEVARYTCPPQITGFEYQVRASIEGIRNGWSESPYMPHAETLRVMRMMDALRKEWGVVYPNDNK